MTARKALANYQIWQAKARKIPAVVDSVFSLWLLSQRTSQALADDFKRTAGRANITSV